MIKVENIDVYGLQHSVDAMRFPMNSWDKSDSGYGIDGEDEDVFVVGKNDLNLMKRLYKAGTEHRTNLRQIMVWMTTTAPLYWWKEMDRYTVGKTQVSCSTMHKIAAKPFTLDDFSFDDYEYYGEWKDSVSDVIDACEKLRQAYLKTKDKSYWYLLIRLLPESYNQKRKICMSYETVFKIIKERTGHKLDEWNEFVEILKGLPYVTEIIGDGKA